MEVEARHLVTNFGDDMSVQEKYLDHFSWLNVDDRLMFEAMSIPGIIGGADSVHLASALRIVRDNPILVTSDAQLGRAARAKALRVFDPLVDGPEDFN